MSQPQTLIQRCEAQGVRLFVDGGELKATPGHLIDDELINLLRENKPKLIECLSVANDADIADAVAGITNKAAEGFNVTPEELEALLDDIDREEIAAGAGDYLAALTNCARVEHKHRTNLNKILRVQVH